MRTMRLAVTIALAGMALAGCSQPTQADRDNRRVLDEILTAITLRNERLLEASARRADERHTQGHLSPADYQSILAFIDKARAGDWPGAEADAYAFRRARPFVRPGQ